jgi:hypothetical protein
MVNKRAQKQNGLWFIEKGTVDVYTRDNQVAFNSMKDGYKTARVKRKSHIFCFH